MSLDKIFDDPELSALIARVEEDYGPDAVSRAIENAYATVSRLQRTHINASEIA